MDLHGPVICPRLTASSFPAAVRGRGSSLDAIPPRVRAEDLDALASLAHGIQRLDHGLVRAVAFDVEEEEVGGVTLEGTVGGGEGLDPGEAHAELGEGLDGLA